MDELDAIRETAERIRIKLANREVVADSAMLMDVWQAVGLLAAHIAILQRQIHAGK